MSGKHEFRFVFLSPFPSFFSFPFSSFPHLSAPLCYFCATFHLFSFLFPSHLSSSPPPSHHLSFFVLLSVFLFYSPPPAFLFVLYLPPSLSSFFCRSNRKSRSPNEFVTSGVVTYSGDLQSKTGPIFEKPRLAVENLPWKRAGIT